MRYPPNERLFFEFAYDVKTNYQYLQVWVSSVLIYESALPVGGSMQSSHTFNRQLMRTFCEEFFDENT